MGQPLDHPLFNGSTTVGIVSGENPRFPSQMSGHEALGSQIQNMGLKGEPRDGRYGAPEKAWMIYGPSREQMYALGKQFGQESVVYSSGGQHELMYTNGPNAGRYHPALDHEFFTKEPEDYYTNMPELGGYLRLNFDWNTLNPSNLAPEASTGALGDRAQHEMSLDKAIGSRKYWQTMYDIKIPYFGTPERKQWDQAYKKALVDTFANGDHKRLVPVKVPLSQLSGSHFVGSFHVGRNADRRPMYQRMAASGDPLPPGVFRRNGSGWTVIDGNNRAEALKAAGHTHFHGYELVDSSPVKKTEFDELYDLAMELDEPVHTVEDVRQAVLLQLKKSLMTYEQAANFAKPAAPHPHAYEWHNEHTDHHLHVAAPGVVLRDGSGELVKADMVCGVCKRFRSTHTYREDKNKLIGTVGGEHEFKTHSQVRSEKREARFQATVDRMREEQGLKKSDDRACLVCGHPRSKHTMRDSDFEPDLIWTCKVDGCKSEKHDFKPKYELKGKPDLDDDGLRKAVGDAHPHMDGSKPPQNDQAAGVGVSTYAKYALPYGSLQSEQATDLHHYPYHSKNGDIDKLVADHGYNTYYAGGKYGRPDLANRNYNTKHLMIYDPSPGSGGDFGVEAYTDAWRKIHELSHALTYPDLNKIYGEGRRIGKLGHHRTLNEALRAVHWEWLAAHKQRELSERIGVHVSDHVFHKELNTVMHDAIHRAVTGKFTEPSGEGFKPHEHKVPLETALGMVRESAHNLGITGMHDLMKNEASLIKTWQVGTWNVATAQRAGQLANNALDMDNHSKQAFQRVQAMSENDRQIHAKKLGINMPTVHFTDHREKQEFDPLNQEHMSRARSVRDSTLMRHFARESRQAAENQATNPQFEAASEMLKRETEGNTMADEKQYDEQEWRQTLAKAIRERVDSFSKEMLTMRQRELKKALPAEAPAPTMTPVDLCPMCHQEDVPGKCKCLQGPMAPQHHTENDPLPPENGIDPMRQHPNGNRIMDYEDELHGINKSEADRTTPHEYSPCFQQEDRGCSFDGHCNRCSKDAKHELHSPTKPHKFHDSYEVGSAYNKTGRGKCAICENKKGHQLHKEMKKAEVADDKETQSPGLLEQRRKFGKDRAPGCKCDYNFTCGACLDAAAKRNAREAKYGVGKAELSAKPKEPIKAAPGNSIKHKKTMRLAKITMAPAGGSKTPPGVGIQETPKLGGGVHLPKLGKPPMAGAKPGFAGAAPKAGIGLQETPLPQGGVKTPPTGIGHLKPPPALAAKPKTAPMAAPKPAGVSAMKSEMTSIVKTDTWRIGHQYKESKFPEGSQSKSSCEICGSDKDHDVHKKPGMSKIVKSGDLGTCAMCKKAEHPGSCR
jgi:hypothetical protein